MGDTFMRRDFIKLADMGAAGATVAAGIVAGGARAAGA